MDIEVDDYVTALIVQREGAMTSLAQAQAIIAKLTRDLEAANKNLAELDNTEAAT